MPPRPIFPKKPTGRSLEARKLLAIEWWQDRLKTTGKITATKIIKKEGETFVLRPGQMVLFRYLAKHRHNLKVLPYWDRFPLVVVLEVNVKKGYMLGINLHYLPFDFRWKVFVAIQKLVKADNPRKNSRAAITYAVFKKLSEVNKLCQNAIKMYLFTHFRSMFVRLTWNEMAEYGIYLDIQQWMRGAKPNPAMQKRAWADTRRMAKAAAAKARRQRQQQQQAQQQQKQKQKASTKQQKQTAVQQTTSKQSVAQTRTTRYLTKRQRQKLQQKPPLGQRWKQRQLARQQARKAARRQRRK